MEKKDVSGKEVVEKTEVSERVDWAWRLLEDIEVYAGVGRVEACRNTETFQV